jgi:phosphopantetheinyl transferase
MSPYSMIVESIQMLAAAYKRITVSEPVSRQISAESNRSPLSFERRVKRQTQSREAHRLLNSLVVRECVDGPPLHLEHDVDGKPRLYRNQEPSSIAVTLSHSRMVVAGAITDLGAIGIDVEFCADRQFENIAAAAFGRAEQRVVTREGRDAFYRIWTLREALAKASRSGTALITDRNDYFADSPGKGSWSAVINNQTWIFWTGVLPGNYASAIAIAAHEPLTIPEAASLGFEAFTI